MERSQPVRALSTILECKEGLDYRVRPSPHWCFDASDWSVILELDSDREIVPINVERDVHVLGVQIRAGRIARLDPAGSMSNNVLLLGRRCWPELCNPLAYFFLTSIWLVGPGSPMTLTGPLQDRAAPRTTGRHPIPGSARVCAGWGGR
jgi:hypothetical protein